MSKRAAEGDADGSLETKITKRSSNVLGDKISVSGCCAAPDLHVQASSLKSAPDDASHGTKLLAETISDGDREYFASYSHLDIHRTMIEDEARTQAYRRAILTNYPLFRGKTVLDVGCGTGILSVFCCQAGARRVYAVEASGAADFARQVATENGYGDRVTVLHCRLEDAALPERVDVIVSEWMGHALLYESMLDSVLLARDRWLRPDGALFPERATLKVALCTAPADEPAAFWRGVHDRYRVHMEVHSHAATVAALDLRTTPAAAVRALRSGPLDLVSFGRARLTGLVLWFDVRFPGGLELSTSPYSAETHWAQTVLPLAARDVDQDWRAAGQLGLRQNGRQPRNWDFEADLTLADAAAPTALRWVLDGAE
ncbi:protein arginine N-methyltransferase 6-like [Pollicipes pollicipes]|uniref:protein arginine N-methyltransferase 6-like n=1 Tax=Pollicipes pollicipes TaxID=41117 RepID=UPI001884CA36|nr:protein arginine N-methyltransferase 6-like [Pollicipes pollicipes]